MITEQDFSCSVTYTRTLEGICRSCFISTGKGTDLLERYYVANDYFRTKSDSTLHILHQFRTYQQATEYTCGAASALMVLHWFGRKQYPEKAVAGLLETHCTRGSSVENIADLFDLPGWNVDLHASMDRSFQTINAALDLQNQIFYPGSFLIGEVTNYDFTPNNTTIPVEEGQIIEMNRRYIS